MFDKNKNKSLKSDLNKFLYKILNGLNILSHNLLDDKKGGFMPWSKGDYPPSYKNQPKNIRDKATEIANEVLKTTHNEGEAIATGLKQARIHFAKEKSKEKP